MPPNKPALKPSRADLEVMVKRGQRAEKFLESDFFKLDLGPWLDCEMRDLAQGALWNPKNDPEPGHVGMACAFNGGGSSQIERIREMVTIWVELGRTAAEKLSQMEA